MVRVQDTADAASRREALRQDRHANPPAHVGKAAGVARPEGEGATGLVADGTDGLTLDYAELAAAQRALDERYREIEGHLGSATELGSPLRDGKGPVSDHMRQSFGKRGGGADGGVQAALRSYLTELAALRETLGQAMAAHQRQDQAAADVVSTAPAE
ncbi:hypothetical protein [Amycolatopsis sp. H20-H5]|uniref:hypothetical protein n=1 Tax=Amycolatopsis sp. H20-H5 TaxID=3046309 RepID=UPI002DB73C4D|nr:hypothetical protein [Amycolatopsis sp. H20-H5]MEC3976723.1 hypothetical protein [Amycolatopsis sp. H20-H5]